MDLTITQAAAVESAGSSFWLGPAGTGKTTALQQRLVHLLRAREPAYTHLVVVAEPEHAQAYLDAVHLAQVGSYSELKITTYIQLAREMVTLFWPLVARPAGFDRPYQPPTFLSYDLAQLLMWRITLPMVDSGAFSNLTLRPQQIVSQLLDTLNRAALNSLTLEESIERQKDSWVGDEIQFRHLKSAAEAAHQFRQACLQNNLLDLSLVVETFDRHLVQHHEFHNYFSERFRHLLVDNVEEQTPAGQHFIDSLIDFTETAAIVYDAGGGYKRFLGADPTAARRFANLCQSLFEFEESFSRGQALQPLAYLVENFLMHTSHPIEGAEFGVIDVVSGRYRREMITKLVQSLEGQIADGIPPKQIALIAPYLDAALAYMLDQELGAAGIPYRLLKRRSRLHDEPRVRSWLTWLSLSHPNWDIQPASYDVAEALTLSIEDLDPVRAQLLADHMFAETGLFSLVNPSIPQSVVERIGPSNVELGLELWQWLSENGNDRYPIDIFLLRLFSDLLGQRRFQAEPDLSGAAICDWLVRTAERLRGSAEEMGLRTPAAIGRTFIKGIQNGLVTSNPPLLGNPPDPEGVLISTIYGYLLTGQTVQVQVWLETGASGWWDIPRQPLSNAFVLAQSWPAGQKWTAEEEFKIRNELLSRIVRGLTARCSGGVILAHSDLDRRGVRQEGPLWRALYPVRNNRIDVES